MNDLGFYGLFTVFQAGNGVEPTTRTFVCINGDFSGNF